MSQPKSSSAPTRERRGGKVLRTVWRRLYRFVEHLDACGECAVATFFGAVFLLIVVGVLK